MNLLERKKISVNPLDMLFERYCVDTKKGKLYSINAFKRQVGKTHTLKDISRKCGAIVLLNYKHLRASHYDNYMVVNNVNSIRGYKLKNVVIEEGFTLDEIRRWILPNVDNIIFGFYQDNFIDVFSHLTYEEVKK